MTESVGISREALSKYIQVYQQEYISHLLGFARGLTERADSSRHSRDPHALAAL